MNILQKQFDAQSGQSLIESIVAIFVLATGLSAGIALAIFVFSASSNIADRIVATSLAREGVEVVRGMRDTNWLQDTLVPCDDVGSGQQCYANWLDFRHNISGSEGGRNYRVNFSPAGNVWSIEQNSNYRLYRVGDAYSHSTTGDPTNFFRKVTIVYAETSGKYSPASPLVLVRSTVWWYGRRCNNTITDLTNPDDTSCKLITEEYLTNWRNY